MKAQPFSTGEISPNFTLPNRSGEPIQLTDFEGKIVVLDFFAFWCAPCSVSSPDIEERIQKHYERIGGNPSGIPVQVLSINLEPESSESTDVFIEKADLNLVVNDFEQKAWTLYNLLGSRPSIPLFVIINGVQDSPSHRPWEVLHSQHGMYILPRQTTAKEFQAAIDSVVAKPRSLPPAINPFQELPLALGGWKESSWLGQINDLHYPWIYSEELAWQFILPDSSQEDGIYFYKTSQGWRFSTPLDYPWMFDFGRDTWILIETTPNPLTP